MVPTLDDSRVDLSQRMGALGSWLCLICVPRRILGKLGDFQAVEGLQVGWGSCSYLWARSPGPLLLPNVLPEASRLSCRAPSAGGDLPFCTVLGCLG